MAEPGPDPGPGRSILPTPTDPIATPARTPGWREVLSIAALVVGFVFGIQVLTSVLPASLQDLVFRTPLTIAVLVIGTVGLMTWLARRPGV